MVGHHKEQRTNNAENAQGMYKKSSIGDFCPAAFLLSAPKGKYGQ
jgi:hypothetical protein